MRRLAHFAIATLTATLALIGRATPAEACGGCLHDPTDNPSVVTDHRMILTVSKDQTTLYDQIHYSGDPKSFAWVLPIHGNVKVGLSADVVFASLDALTSTVVHAPPLPSCPPPPYCGGSEDSPSAAPSAQDAGAFGGSDGVNVKKDEVVGPYEAVQLSSTDPKALADWLAKNNFVVPKDVQPIVDAYQKEGFDFLALKLLPGQNVQSMRPVRVTMPGASATLPLRMVSAGTGASVGITLFVVADGRYEPANFPTFFIADDELVWDWQTTSSNYKTLRAQKQAATKNHSWELESSTSQSKTVIEDAVRNGGMVFRGNGGGFGGAPGGIAPAAADYAPTTGANPQSADQVRDEDVATLLQGQSATPRVTRLRTDLAHDALVVDLSLNASADQKELSADRQVTKAVNVPVCPTYPPCPLGTGGFVGVGCAALPQTHSVAGDAMLLGGLGLVGIAIGRRRRNAKR